MYKPTDADLEWAKMVIRMTTDGGLIVYDNAGLQYRIDHRHQILTLTNPEVLAEPEPLETHRRTVVVFAAFGYNVNEVYSFVQKDEVHLAADRLGEHMETCPKCGNTGQPFMCMTGYGLLREFHTALYMATVKTSNTIH